jgi:hypothetical protein
MVFELSLSTGCKGFGLLGWGAAFVVFFLFLLLAFRSTFCFFIWFFNRFF